MPTVHSIIPETETHILLPVANQVAHYIIDSLGLSQHINNDIFIDTGWTTVKGTQDNHKFRIRKNSLQMKATLRSIAQQKWEYQNSHFSTGYGIPHYSIVTQYPKLVDDPAANIVAYEMFLPCTLVCECNFWFTNRNLAYELLDKLQHRYTPGTTLTISLNYDFPLPKDILSLLYSLYKHRRFGTERPFSEYFSLIACQRFDVVERRAQGARELVIEKNLIDSLITFEHEVDRPTENKNKKTTEFYDVPLTVTVQFQRSSEIILKYPCVVDNTLIPSVLIPNPGRNHDLPIASARGHHPVPYIDRTYRFLHPTRRDPIRFPFYDDWLPPYNHLRQRTYHPFFISMYLIDETDKTVIDLRQLQDGYSLHPVVLEILKLQGKESFQADVIFNVALYLNDSFEDSSKLEFTDDLKIVVDAKSIYQQRRLVISEISDYGYLNPKWWELIKEYPDFFYPNTIGEHRYVDWPIRIFWNTIVTRGPESTDDSGSPTGQVHLNLW